MMQLLGIRGAVIGFGFRDILQNLLAGVRSLLRIQGDDFAQQCLGASLLYLTNLLGITLSCMLASLIAGYTPLHRAQSPISSILATRARLRYRYRFPQQITPYRPSNQSNTRLVFQEF
ncbi:MULTISPECIES: hypothetical protein [unclassified Microcoleus]|uniref:hypothetical protein n=1 Tax=unclassified Microcoleus TaxID=2642155 RepID=UPI002FD353CE